MDDTIESPIASKSNVKEPIGPKGPIPDVYDDDNLEESIDKTN